jgi:hypothetical protein
MNPLSAITDTSLCEDFMRRILLFSAGVDPVRGRSAEGAASAAWEGRLASNGVDTPTDFQYHGPVGSVT